MTPWTDRRAFLPKGLKAERIQIDADGVLVYARATNRTATCPNCGSVSRHIHSHYQRRLADLPAHGRKVRLVLDARRFRCRVATCQMRVFAERFSPAIILQHARRTGRLQDLVRHLGLALGGRPAQALAARLLMPVSKDTFLRSVRNAAPSQGGAPRVVGIDDWAWGRGQRYGTLICDLERRQVIDLLPNREPASVEAWLGSHPQIELVARDRNGGYAGAVARALPRAVQVADRWHLLENASAAFLVAVRRNMPMIRRLAGASDLDPALLTAAERLQYEGFQRRRQTNDTVRQMVAEGIPIKRIVRATGLSRGLVRGIVRGERDDIFRTRQNSLTPWLVRLEQEWAAGCRNATEIWRRLRAVGFNGSLRVVGEWATRQRRAESARSLSKGKCPSARRIAQLMTSARDHLSRADAVFVTRIEAALPALAIARLLVARFTDMVRNGISDGLTTWLEHAVNSEVGSFARGLRSDQAAVSAALSEPWSNGQTEGQINRLKTLKRQMYGRANIDLLKARLVATP